MSKPLFRKATGTVLWVSIVVGALACAAPPNDSPAIAGGAASWATIQLSHAVAWGVPASGSMTVGLVVQNLGETNYAITGISSTIGTAELHGSVDGAMAPLAELAIPPGKTLILGDGGPHIMITGVADSAWAAGVVPIVVEFSSGSTVLLEAAFLNYGAAMRVLRSK